MKPLPKKADLPDHEISAFRNFMRTVLKKRVFIFSLILGAVALFIQLLLTDFSVPQFYAFGFVFLGFAWAAYQAYRELSLDYQTVIYPIPTKKIKASVLSVSLMKGNEYAYSISDPLYGQNHLISRMQNTGGMKVRFDERGVCFVNDKIYYIMGKAGLEINLQLQNSGDLPFEILSIKTDNDLNLNHLRLFHKGIFLHGTSLPFPLHLDGGDRVILQSRYEISMSRGSTDALFAADFQALPRSITHVISVDTIDASDNKETYISEIKTSSRPLINLYVKQWREYDQEEYLVLAGHHLAGDA